MMAQDARAWVYRKDWNGRIWRSSCRVALLPRRSAHASSALFAVADARLIGVNLCSVIYSDGPDDAACRPPA